MSETMGHIVHCYNELKRVTKSHAYIVMPDYFISSCDIVVDYTTVGVLVGQAFLLRCRILFSVYSIGVRKEGR